MEKKRQLRGSGSLGSPLGWDLVDLPFHRKNGLSAYPVLDHVYTAPGFFILGIILGQVLDHGSRPADLGLN